MAIDAAPRQSEVAVRSSLPSDAGGMFYEDCGRRGLAKIFHDIPAIGRQYGADVLQ